jgi:alpha-beta hydrolase superfamily lysophospholipase
MRVALVAVLVAVLLASCAPGSSDRAAVVARAAGALPAFYDVPAPLPSGQPGDVIKTEPQAVAGLHGTIRRVMYHSQSITGADIAVTGLIAVPNGAAPAGGFPVVTWAHGTTGIADECAPSLDPGDFNGIANALLDAGYVVVGTDYEGLGTPGRHPYIVGESEARGTIDIVRAARNLPDVSASDRYVVWGHSQGGHAAMFALHIADAWAPELHLVGVVAGAPPSQLSLVYQALKTSPFRYYLLMAAAGFNAAYGDQGAPLDEVLTPKGVQAVSLVDDGCTGELAAATAGFTTEDLLKADPQTVPAWAKLLADNDPGKFPAPAAQPLLVIQGGNDEQIPVAASALMFDQLCAIGQVQQRWIYPGRSHSGVIGVSLTDMLTWIGNRFANVTNPDPLVPTGQSDVQAQTCPASLVATPTSAPTTSTTPPGRASNELARTG